MSMKMLLAAVAAAITLAVSAGATLAAPGFATTSVNVRSGPGTSYRVVDTLRPGQRVDIGRCSGVWCFVTKPGPNGWVNSSFLEYAAAPPVVVRPPPVIVQPPLVVRPPFFGPSRPGIRPPFRPGRPGVRPPPGRPGVRPPGRPRPPGGGGRPSRPAICRDNPSLPVCRAR